MQLFVFFIFDFMNFMLFIIKFIKFKPIIKFKKFECHSNAVDLITVALTLSRAISVFAPSSIRFV